MLKSQEDVSKHLVDGWRKIVNSAPFFHSVLWIAVYSFAFALRLSRCIKHFMHALTPLETKMKTTLPWPWVCKASLQASRGMWFILLEEINYLLELKQYETLTWWLIQTLTGGQVIKEHWKKNWRQNNIMSYKNCKYINACRAKIVSTHFRLRPFCATTKELNDEQSLILSWLLSIIGDNHDWFLIMRCFNLYTCHSVWETQWSINISTYILAFSPLIFLLPLLPKVFLKMILGLQRGRNVIRRLFFFV